jgi:hypothetical protein
VELEVGPFDPEAPEDVKRYRAAYLAQIRGELEAATP